MKCDIWSTRLSNIVREYVNVNQNARNCAATLQISDIRSITWNDLHLREIKANVESFGSRKALFKVTCEKLKGKGRKISDGGIICEDSWMRPNDSLREITITSADTSNSCEIWNVDGEGEVS